MHARMDNPKPICPVNFFEIGGIDIYNWTWYILKNQPMQIPKYNIYGRLFKIHTRVRIQYNSSNEPRHDKTNKMAVRPAKTQISLDICPVWSQSSLSAWRKLGSLATHWAHIEDSVQTGQMPRLIWVFAGRTRILLVLSCRSSNEKENSFSTLLRWERRKVVWGKKSLF